ncbi:MAG: hypothetical protein ACLFUJ_05040 [Phycisphaerae bacterium]
MNGRLVACPACGTLLDAPPEAADCIVRCGNCKKRFRLPKKLAATGDAIASWLWTDRNVEEDEEPAQPVSSGKYDPKEESMMFLADLHEQDPAGAIRLVRLGSEGALFEYSAHRMEDEVFRSAMPRLCVRCSSRVDLVAHPIIFAQEMDDSVSLAAEYAAGALKMDWADVRKLTGPQVLAKLGSIPNLPHPASLPMPFWICDICSGVGLVSGQCNIDPSHGSGWFRLRIANLEVAEKFLINLGKENSVEHAEIRLRIDSLDKHPWMSLSASVQHRIEQWYQPKGQEQFLAYVPDRDRSTTEDGVYGIIVTDQRMIFHCKYRHYESPRDLPIHLEWSTRRGRMVLHMRSPGWESPRFYIDRQGLALLRKALQRGQFAARWY